MYHTSYMVVNHTSSNENFLQHYCQLQKKFYSPEINFFTLTKFVLGIIFYKWNTHYFIYLIFGNLRGVYYYYLTSRSMQQQHADFLIKNLVQILVHKNLIYKNLGTILGYVASLSSFIPFSLLKHKLKGRLMQA